MAAEIRLAGEDAEQPWAPALLRSAREALSVAEERLGLELHGTVTIRTFATEAAFHEAIGARPTHVIAVARPQLMEIDIPRGIWFAADAATQREAMIHEMAHLIIGRRIAKPLPVWLNEGMAMLASGQGSFGDRARLTAAGVFGSLIPLGDLENDVLLGGERQHLAYAQSLSVTRFYLARSHEGDLRKLAHSLASLEKGEALHEQLFAPMFREALDAQWRAQYETVWNWIAFLSGASVLWFFITLLFLLAVWRKRRMARQVIERFEREEFDDSPPVTMDEIFEDDEDDEAWRG